MAHLAIERLVARRIRAMDGKDWDTYRSLHSADHVSETFNGPPSVGAESTTRRLATLLADVTSVHHAMLPDIKVTSRSGAMAVWAMEDRLFWRQGEEAHWLHGFGHYHERYRKEDGVWRFTYRKLTRIHVEMSVGARLGELNIGDREIETCDS